MTNTRTVVYGASDDLIEIEGHLCEEFAGGDGPRYVALANGVLLKVTYDDNEGIWRVVPRSGFAHVEIVFARGDDEPRDEDGCPGYSDKAVILNAGSWVVVGDECECEVSA